VRYNIYVTMTTSIAEYYIEELEDLKKSIDFHIPEIEDAQEWLQRIIAGNTIPKLAAMVEHYTNILNLCRLNYVYLKGRIQSLSASLLKDDMPLENGMITDDLKKMQSELRANMFGIEKEYLEIKYNANVFLSDTITRQNKITNHNQN
jgi:hypothetical protein